MCTNNDTNHVRPVLYYDEINPHSRAVLMILNMLDIDIELRAIEMIRGEHLMPAYAKINPAHTVPTMVHNDLVITDNAIFSYVCENHDNEKAKELIAFGCYKGHCHVLSRLFFESQVLHRIHGQLMTDLLRKTIYETDIDYHRKKVEHAYDVMERYLADGPYMAGFVLTAADISFVACLGALDMVFPIAADHYRWAKLNDWYWRMRALSVQKINTNGIEKQRQIIEYFAKYQFTSGLRRFTTGVRASHNPQFSLRHCRCSIGVQTTEAQQTEPIGEYTLQADLVVVKSAGDNTTDKELLQQTPCEMEVQIETNSSPDVAAESIESGTHQNVPLEASAPLLESQLVDNNSVPQSMADATLQVEKSSNLAHKVKPPVPPRSKRNMIIVMTSTESVNAQHADNTRIDQKSALPSSAYEEPESDFEEKLKNPNSKDECGVIFKAGNLSRLDGGIEPTVASEMPSENEIVIPPVKAYPPIPVNNSAEISKDSQKTESTTALNSLQMSTDSQVEASKISLLPPRLLINCPQVALQYARSVNAPVVAVTAPPPSPENSSQDEQTELEFPTLPTEVPIQNPHGRGQVARPTKLADTNKAGVVAKNLSGVKSALGNSKSTSESVARILGKNSSVLKSIRARKIVGNEPKESKVVRKTNKALLLASDTRSLCSNFSQSSLRKDKARKVQKTLKESKTMQKLISPIANSTLTKAQGQKKRKMEKCSGAQIVESSGSTKNEVQKASGRSLSCSAPLVNAKGADKRRRAEGRGQWHAEEKAPSTSKAVDTQSKLLGAISNESTGAEVKSTTVSENKVHNTTEVASAKLLEQATSTTENTSSKIPVKSVKKEVKPANQAGLTMKNKLKVYPAKGLAPNQTKITQSFDTSSCKADVGSYKNQSKTEVGKRPIAQSKKKSESKATSEEILRSTQSPLLETTCASTVSELECVAKQSTMEENRKTDLAMLENVTPATAAEKTLSTSPDNSILPAIIETPDADQTAIMARTSSSHQANSFTAEEASVTVGLVAKEPEIASVNNIIKISPPPPPPLPPPPVPFHYKLKQPSPPSNVPINDVLTQVGTVAKMLQFLSTLGTEEGNSLCGTTKPVKKPGLKMKSIEEEIIPKMKNATLNENITRIMGKTVAARPLAEILTATAQLRNRKMVERTNETELTNETQQSFAKTKRMSDKTVAGNMAQAAGEQAIVTNIKETAGAAELDCQTTPVAALNALNKPADKELMRMKEDKKFAEVEVISRAHTQSPFTEVESPRGLVAPMRAEPIAVSVPTKKISISFITNLPESATKSTQAAHNRMAKAPQINRNIIEGARASEDSATLEPTSLPAQPNVIITGYIRAETNTALPGTGHAVGDIIVPTLRRHSTGPCSHGASANVPMSDLNSTPEQLIPVGLKFIVPTPPPPPPPPPMPRPVLNKATKMAATTLKSVPQFQSGIVMPVRVPSSRMREDILYPSAHRSRSRRGDERKINHRG